MNIYYSPLIALDRGQSIVVKSRCSETCVYAMSLKQLRQFITTESIRRDWMPFDHVLDLSECKPAAKFEAFSRSKWIMVIRGTVPHLPILIAELDGAITRLPWIQSTCAKLSSLLPPADDFEGLRLAVEERDV